MYNHKYHSINLSNLSILVTGGAGFIGSNIVEYLVKYGVGKVRVLDNFSTGSKVNIDKFLGNSNVELIEGDIRNLSDCLIACDKIDYVLHQAALGSVPRSIENPILTNEVNITGFLNMLVAVKDKKVKRLIYAASSSTYGDSRDLPKVEHKIGNPLSPYAITKYVNELYADVFSKTYNIEVIGLRYFNVFGPKQSPKGAYAAVIPLLIDATLNHKEFFVNGDGSQTRDFTFIENVVQANIKSIEIENKEAINQVYNIACGERISITNLYETIRELSGIEPLIRYRESREGDVKDSLGDISKAQKNLNYQPFFNLRQGLRFTIDYFNQTF